MKTIVLFAIGLSLLTNIFCQENRYTGKIIAVIDGDTFVFQTETGSFKVRMYGIDAPEKDQEFGKESKCFMDSFKFKDAYVIQSTTDKYGRFICRIFVNNQDISLLSLTKGMSWHYSYFSKDLDYAQAEQQAKKNKLGLWKNDNPTPPWNWRKEHKN